jgi:polysaccharide export outer membrane protein
LPNLPPFFNPPPINDPDAALREELERRLANDPNQWRAYRLAPLDSIGIQVAGFADLSTAASVDPEGRILVPLLGRLLVEGLTLQEVEDLLRVGFDRYVINPDVTVVLNSQVNPDVTISGEVVKPGFYRLSAYDTVSGALRTAGGVTGHADLRTVRLRRLLPDGTIAEKTFDLIGAIIEGNPEQAVVIQDGDTVIVPRRDPSNAPNYDIALAARTNLAQPNIRIRILSYAAGGMTTLTLPNGSTFVDAISGTPIDTARLSRMALIRFDPEQGRAVTMTLNGKEAFLGDPTQNPQLQDNDVIVINRNLVARITYALNTFTQPFRDVLGFLLFFDEIQGASDSLFGPGAIFGTEEEETTGGSSNRSNN